jgi:hypothetical protein
MAFRVRPAIKKIFLFVWGEFLFNSISANWLCGEEGNMHHFRGRMTSIQGIRKPTPVEFMRYGGGSWQNLWHSLDDNLLK